VGRKSSVGWKEEVTIPDTHEGKDWHQKRSTLSHGM